MNLNQKLIEIRKELPYLKKGTKGYQYSYVSGSEILYKIQTKMNELGILLYPEITNCTLERNDFTQIVKDKKGDEYEKFRQERFTVSNGFYVWEDAEKGDIKKVSWVFMGEMDDSSKSIGSALTYAERYFLLKFFNIPTDEDDPDAFQKKNSPPPIPVKAKPMTKSQKEELESIAKKLPVVSAGKLNNWLKGNKTSFDSALKSLEHYREVLKKEKDKETIDQSDKTEEVQNELPL